MPLEWSTLGPASYRMGYRWRMCSSVLITLFSVWTHARNYRNRVEQKQIIRILYMPAVRQLPQVTLTSSYPTLRCFTSCVDLRHHIIPLIPVLPRLYVLLLVEVVNEAVTISAFLLLLIQYVAATASGSKAENVLLRKDKQPLPFPFCFWRFRPTKPSIHPKTGFVCLVLCVIGIITQALGVLCVQIYSPHFAEVYIVAIDFVSIRRTELVGRRPLAKFLCIKGIVMLTFYQEFVFSVLQKYKVIHATEFWTATNVADGLNALATTIEMVFFAAFMLWAYPVSEYKDDSLPKTSFWRPLWDSINYADFGREIFGSVAFFIRYLLGRPNTHTPKGNSYPAQSSYQGVQIPQASTSRIDFGDAFGL
ncbi:hypothetical protein M422DRAFT_242741, partial [Sphaerobolus stellatus SS14]